MSKPKTGLELLDEIRPVPAKRRFLQDWDRETRVLRFGCGDEKNAIQICSDRSVEPYESPRPTKLQGPTVKTFLAGQEIDSPLADVKDVLTSYVYFSDPRITTLVAVWVVGTYMYSMFSHYGYLFLHSPTPRCGKTRAEEIVSHLAFEATPPRNAPTPPSMRETAVEGGTAIFDTLERWKEKGTESFAAAMELLDAGFRKGGVVTKMVPAGEGEWRLQSYPVYAPYMFAAIDENSLTNTALDRSFVIEMRRKNTKQVTRAYDDAVCEAACAPLRDKLYLAALSRAQTISDVYGSEQLAKEMGQLGLNDRASDIWKPIFAVAKILGDEAAVAELRSLAQQMSPDPDRQENVRQLRIASGLRTLAGPGGSIEGTTQQIMDRLMEVAGIECLDLYAVLSEWQFEQVSMRLPELGPRKAWDLSDEALAAIEQRLADWRYPPETATTTTTNAG